MGKRIFYNYYLRDLSVASFELPIGAVLFSFGVTFGIWQWMHAVQSETATPLGTVMLAALPSLMGLQLILAFLSFDVSSVPSRAIHRQLSDSIGQT